MKLLFLITFLTSCVTTPNNEPLVPFGVDVAKIRSSMNAWPEQELTKEGYLKDITHDCDGALWQGQWCAATGCDLTVGYESKSEPGRFYRRATDDKCWNDRGENGSKTTWSRDMFMCGLLPWALKTKNGKALDRHARYGWKKTWVMGDPPLLDDIKSNSRLFYTPTTQAVLHRAIHHLGGPLYPEVAWGWVVSHFQKMDMPPDLDDYEAHLQVCKIWARGEMENGISDVMKDRLKDHHFRVPEDPFYAVMYGKYFGDWGPATKACTRSLPWSGDYVRCGKSTPACAYAHSVFACNLLIEEHEGGS